MPTSSVNITSSWTKVANQTDNSLLMTWKPVIWVEVATTASDAAPSIDGHLFEPGYRVTRQDIGDGFVWARTLAGSTPSQIAVTVSTATSSNTTKGYDAADDMIKVKSMQKKFRDDFPAASLNTSKWDAVQGSGTAISTGSGSLTITSGTTVNAEAFILSKETFTLPFRVQVGLSMSQRIANHTLYVEAVSVDPVTGVPDNKNTAAFIFNGTTATQGIYRVQNDGATVLDSGLVTVPTTASTSLYELEPFCDEAWFHGGAVDGTTSRSNSYRRHQNLPDPNAVYKIRIRSVNGGTAPASSTTCTVSFVSAQDYAELTAEITGGRGQATPGQGIGVVVTNSLNSTITGSVAANSTEVVLITPTHYQLTSAASTNTASVKASGGTVYGILATNMGASAAYLKLYNKASAPTLASDVPVQVITIPANSFVQVNPGRVGLRLGTGIATAVTGAAAFTDTTATTASQVLVSIEYI